MKTLLLTACAAWLALPAMAAEPGAEKATDKAPSDKAAPLRMENPEDKAQLVDKINQAIQRAQQQQAASARKGSKAAPPPEVPTLQVQVPPPAPPKPASKPASKPRAKPPTAARATPPVVPAAAVTAAPAPSSNAKLTGNGPGNGTNGANGAELSPSRRELRERAAALAAQLGPLPAAPPRPAGPEPDPRTVVWSYAGANGPDAWGRLHSRFATCAQGQRQSPLHITAQDLVAGPAEPLRFQEAAFGGHFVHDGHGLTLEVDQSPTLPLRGQLWRLRRLELHHPAEEQVLDQRFDMAADLVYEGPRGELLVVSVPMRVEGAPNPFLAQLWPHMPLEAGDKVRLPHPLPSLSALLPTDRRYVHYLGSLTRPPCTEGVLRVVLKHPAGISLGQLQQLQRTAPTNARPVQPTHGRTVRDAQ